MKALHENDGLSVHAPGVGWPQTAYGFIATADAVVGARALCV